MAAVTSGPDFKNAVQPVDSFCLWKHGYRN